jgi:hypothetical protein
MDTGAQRINCVFEYLVDRLANSLLFYCRGINLVNLYDGNKPARKPSRQDTP